MRRFIFCLFCTLLVAPAIGLSQSPASSASSNGVESDQSEKPIDENLRFAAASIRPWDPKNNEYSEMNAADTNRFRIKRLTISFLAGMAYGIGGVGESHILNKPKWSDSQAYTIEAVTANGKPATREEQRIMLRNLLKDRFHLVAHVETRYVSGYALVTIPDKKPNLQHTDAAGLNQLMPGDLRMSNASMNNLASILESITGTPCIDKTQIEGTYNIRLRYAYKDDPNSEYPSAFVAIQEQLGLKLIPDKNVPVKYLLIDSVDKTPTEN